MDLIDMEKERESYCACCKQIKPINRFYKRIGEDDQSVYPYCRKCYTTKFRAYRDALKLEDAAAWCLFAEMGIAFYGKVWEKVKHSATSKATDHVANYISYLRGASVETGFWASDTMLDDIVEISKDKVDVSNKQHEDKLNLQEQAVIWGLNVDGSAYSEKDYKFLNQTYESYTADILDMDTAKMMRYKDLCKAELRKFNGDTSKETLDEILKLMKLLKIDNFQENKQSETEKFIDRWAWKIENEEPAEDRDLTKYKDYAGNEKMWRGILRTVFNAISGTRNYPDLKYVTSGDDDET